MAIPSSLAVAILANLVLASSGQLLQPPADTPTNIAESAAQYQANYPHDIGRISAGNAPVAQAAPAFTSVPLAPPTPVSTGVAALAAPPPQHSLSRAPQTTSGGRARPNRITLVRQRLPTVAPESEPEASDPISELVAQVAAERRQQARAAMAAQQQQDQVQPELRAPASIGSPLSALSAPHPIATLPAPPSSQLLPRQINFQQAPAEPAPSQMQAFTAAAAAVAASSQAQQSGAEFEPLPAPSFDHILSQGCPQKGVFSYENKDHCDKYYLCTNGTFTEEACPNGLAYSQMGAVYHHCAYNWNVDCGRKKTSEPISSPGCPWQFGIFPVENNGRCSIEYYVCEWGVPETKRCTPEGLFYDDRIKGCQWADQLGCKSEAQLNFKCPPEDEDNPYWPYPRYYHSQRDVIVCVNEQPRLVHCNDEQAVEPGSLACVDLVKKKKKKF